MLAKSLFISLLAGSAIPSELTERADRHIGLAVASPVKRQENGGLAACDGVDQEASQSADLTCPAIQGLSGLLTFQVRIKSYVQDHHAAG